MPLHRGTRVVATRTLGTGRVPAGSVGRVVKVGFFGGYDVTALAQGWATGSRRPAR